MKLFFDTNAIIDMFAGRRRFSKFTAKAEVVYISMITVLEFYSFSELNENDKNLFAEFKKQVSICDISHADQKLIDSVANLRIKYRIKLPDAIILAQAILADSRLLTSDKNMKRIQKQEQKMNKL